MNEVKIDHLKTESRNPRTLKLDTMSTMELLRIMNEEDQKVIDAVKEALPQIEKCIQLVIHALNNNGRLIYIGAGTSGRLGILDAVECVPTFSTTDEVIGIIAGGEKAFVRAVEGAEDSEELAVKDLEAVNAGENDVIVGIAASGRTP
ncbi:MAG: N-acetylmuramic acid 6-phosphate etherase [Epulopiscium sp.]|nr:N-acetylmuramic acid 6-phosphate etherase [Candidatus Epulonipiscium sp.]